MHKYRNRYHNKYIHIENKHNITMWKTITCSITKTITRHKKNKLSWMQTVHNNNNNNIYNTQQYFGSIPSDQVGLSYTERQARRLAEQMKDENVESEYMDRLRGDVASADSLIAGLEHELLGEIAMALKGSEDKVNWALLQCDLIEKENNPTKENIEKHKFWRKEVDDRRRNLIIHRQACGFRINNYSFVQKLFPIPKKWPSSGKEAIIKKNTTKSPNKIDDKNDIPWEEKMRRLYARRR